LVLNYDSTIEPEELAAKHIEWARRQTAPLRVTRQHPNEPSEDRRLKIGYVSGDFRQHPVGFLIDPILAHHDHQRYEVYCYSNSPDHDELAARQRTLADHWRDIAAMEDEQVAQTIHDDRIDVLVDLAGHTARNRLLVFARKP